MDLRLKIMLLCAACLGAGSAFAEPGAIGEARCPGRVALVYQAGSSPFPLKAARILQEELASRGYSVDLLDIGQGARFLPAQYRALVLLSPVRGGLLMPQALEFIAENAPFTMPVLVMLTGWFPGLFEDHDLPALKESLQARGTALKAAVKVGTGFGKRLVRERAAVLADAIAGGE